MKFSLSGPEGFLLPLPFSVKLINLKLNGFPVFITSHGDFFFVVNMGLGLVWAVGPILGDSSSIWLKNYVSVTTTIPTFGWMYLFDDIWLETLELQLISIPLTSSTGIIDSINTDTSTSASVETSDTSVGGITDMGSSKSVETATFLSVKTTCTPSLSSGTSKLVTSSLVETLPFVSTSSTLSDETITSTLFSSIATTTETGSYTSTAGKFLKMYIII